jgi:hypothetical protein
MDPEDVNAPPISSSDDDDSTSRPSTLKRQQQSAGGRDQENDAPKSFKKAKAEVGEKSILGSQHAKDPFERPRFTGRGYGKAHKAHGKSSRRASSIRVAGSLLCSSGKPDPVSPKEPRLPAVSSVRDSPSPQVSFQWPNLGNVYLDFDIDMDLDLDHDPADGKGAELNNTSVEEAEDRGPLVIQGSVCPFYGEDVEKELLDEFSKKKRM